MGRHVTNIEAAGLLGEEDRVGRGQEGHEDLGVEAGDLGDVEALVASRGLVPEALLACWPVPSRSRSP